MDEAVLGRRFAPSLRRVHEGLLAAIKDGPALDDPRVLQGVIALVGHGAYHLGAIQATLRVLGSG